MNKSYKEILLEYNIRMYGEYQGREKTKKDLHYARLSEFGFDRMFISSIGKKKKNEHTDTKKQAA